MIRDIVVYPDKRLKEISQPVERFDEELHTLLDDMYETMIAKNGVGLAAIQVAVPVRALIINVPVDTDSEDPRVQQPKENTLEVINPVILDAEGKTRYQEGCLSVPGYFEEVERYKAVRIEYQDRYGEKHILEDDDFLAIAVQHEMDHLEGRLFIEKLSLLKRKKFEKEWKKRLRGKK
ncbi:peptide deformylase [Nitratifractor salsuginis]|uniref:Peptide deformylase n=1 Tax=Nitratifractor salsuginis (strain DSM 16511 / JCM 12458 / E9I37-1) TaxID=749222 RepID=E6WXW4_NITSE|nr:peptide deformylase [Nitratifractor salsuginis]ADV45285.1 peptide deformylase [Nitratifractor salsuginis DSM 16511]